MTLFASEEHHKTIIFTVKTVLKYAKIVQTAFNTFCNNLILHDLLHFVDGEILNRLDRAL